MCFFFNDTATPEIYTLSLHDALPIFEGAPRPLRRTGHRLDGAFAIEGAQGDRRAHVVAERLRDPQHVVEMVRTDGEQDRKSTRLNSSHANISYAVFCLKKKKMHLQIL